MGLPGRFSTFAKRTQQLLGQVAQSSESGGHVLWPYNFDNDGKINDFERVTPSNGIRYCTNTSSGRLMGPMVDAQRAGVMMALDIPSTNYQITLPVTTTAITRTSTGVESHHETNRTPRDPSPLHQALSRTSYYIMPPILGLTDQGLC